MPHVPKFSGQYTSPDVQHIDLHLQYHAMAHRTKQRAKLWFRAFFHCTIGLLLEL
jgi:predicted membrane channel-forming protein YqfA (hemolysin III family)